MASQMVIPASNDTLFMRGFSSRHHIDDIRDFFTREGGRNTVEFFKENATGDGLFLALKFESKSVAKDIINRYDGYEVLGDRVNISWYKDIRKARTYDSAPPFRQRPQPWGQDRYDYRGGSGNYNRGGRGQYNRGSGQRGWYPRGGEYGDSGGSRSRRYTRSSSHSRSRSGSPHSRSRSYTRSSSRDDHDSRSRSVESRERTRKRQRSASEGSRRRSSARKGKARDQSSASRSPQLDDLGSQSDSDSATPPPRPGKASKKSKASQKKDGAALPAGVSSDAGAVNDKAKESLANVSGDFEESEMNEFGLEDVGAQPAQTTVASKAARAVRSAISTVDKQTAASKRLAALKNTSLDDAIEAANVPQHDVSPAAVTKKQETGKTKKQRPDRRMYEDPISDDSEPQGHRQPQDERNKRSAPTVDPSSPVNGPFEEPPVKRKVATIPKKLERNAQKDFDLFENNDDEEVEPPTGLKTRNRRHEAEEVPTRGAAGARDEKSRRVQAGVTSGLSSSTKKAAPSRDGGVLGLSHEKMLLVRQKKDEIEKAYRQDCETFATVTKMLINKEPSLEDKIQDSLRENLKEIGQRCIQELREFIDRLREEDEPDEAL